MENEEDEDSKGHFEAIAHKLRSVLISELKGLKTKTGNELVRAGRLEKFRKMGEFNETTKKATGTILALSFIPSLFNKNRAVP
jgi:hypothetical protein